MALTSDKIIELSSRQGVKPRAVKNFLWTVSANPDKESALANLKSDARAYGWNDETTEAIRIGILAQFGE
jgi:hypothetical protein